jgi:hypothetical protein
MLSSPSKLRLLRMNERVYADGTASELQDRITELIEQQAAISKVLRAIANSPHDLQRHPRQRRASLSSRYRQLASLRRRRPSSRGGPRGPSSLWTALRAIANCGRGC